MLKMNKKGFTLVELLVVLAILGLLAGIGIPQYMKTLERSREAADNAIIAVVQSAVDGYLTETGLKPDDTGIIALQGSGDDLQVTAKGTSMLTGIAIEFRDFLDPGFVASSGTDTGKVILPPQTAFKSKKYKEGTDFAWKVNDNGKVSVSVTAPTT